MEKSLKTQAVNGIIWNSVERVGNRAAQFVVTVILARLLLPRHFGLIGMIIIFIEISQTFLDAGFGQALIQKKETTKTDYSTVFYFNIGIGIILYFIIFLSAPLIASFYKESMLIPIVRVLGISIIINSLSLIQNTILIKKVDFKTLAKINISSAVFAGIISIFMALKGLGVWSLVAQLLISRFVILLLLWFSTKWIPILKFSKDSFMKLFSFGSKLLISRLLSIVFRDIYLVVIGKAFTTETLGYYTQAYKLQQYSSQIIGSVFQKVTFPVFSKIQDENIRLKRGFKKTLQGIAFINFPLMLGLIAIANPLILVLFGKKWLPAVPFFQLLCIVGFLYPIQAMNLNIIKVKGRSDLFLKLEVLKIIIISLAIVVSFPFGIIALIIGQVITSFIAFYINSYYSGLFIKYGIKEQLLDLKPSAFSSIFMAISTWFLGFLIKFNVFVKLPIQIIFAVFMYLLLSKLFNFEALRESLNIVKTSILNKDLTNP
ncbi:MAG: lipopolysaccharide biosynthesis protein [Candidatus Helarchaeota archaeon]